MLRRRSACALAVVGLAALPAAPAAAQVSPPTVREPYVVFTVGDSYAAGEGAPHANGVYDAGGDPFTSGFRPEDWDTRFSRSTQEGIDVERCHRSPLSSSGVAAGYLDADFPDIQLVFQSVACSGASITRGSVLDRDDPDGGNAAPENAGGVLRPYAGADGLSDFDPRPSRPVFPAQLNQIDDRLNASAPAFERLDALIVGIGGNDAGFANFVVGCADVPTKGSPNDNCTTDDDLIAFRDARLGLLPNRYDRLNASLESNNPTTGDAELDSDHRPQAVLMTAIPRVARSSSTGFCDRQPAGDQTAKVTAAESRFLEDTMRAPLNNAMDAAADRHSWVFVASHVDDFTGHAICQGASDRWINTNNDGLRKQGDLEDTDIGFGLDIVLPDFSGGWVHPNARGFSQIGGALYRKLAGQLVQRFTPGEAPAVIVFNQADRAVALIPHQAEGERATQSGNYRALKLLQVSATGTNTAVTGADGFRLLGYGDHSTSYARTGRFLIVARSCAPLARDASIGCGPPRVVRTSTLVPAAPVEVVARAVSRTFQNGLSGVAVAWRHAGAGSAHDTTSSRVRVTGTSAGNLPFDQTFSVSGRRTAAALGELPFGIYTVTVEACNQQVGCSPASAPVSIGVGLISGFDPDAIRIANYACSRTAIAWGVPQKVLPSRNGTDGTITLLDPNRSIVPTCLDEPVGHLSVKPRGRSVRPGRRANLTVGWEHPVRWGELKSVQVRLRSGQRTVSTLSFDAQKRTLALARGARSGGRRVRLPSRKRRALAAGSVRALVGRKTFRRPPRRARSVRLRLGLVFGRALAGRRLTVEMSATGTDGERQAFRQGGFIRVRRR